jgi:hypothetical protein
MRPAGFVAASSEVRICAECLALCRDLVVETNAPPASADVPSRADRLATAQGVWNRSALVDPTRTDWGGAPLDADDLDAIFALPPRPQPEAQPDLRCSTCGAAPGHTSRLVSGRSALICTDCILRTV